MDGFPQDLGHNGLHPFKGVGPLPVVADDEVQVGQDAVFLIAVHQRQQLLVVPLVVLPLGPALLELLGPELLVLHLVDRQEHKVQGIFLKKGPEPGDGVDLHPKLQPGFQGDPVPVPLPQFPDGGMVLGIIHIGQELAVLPDHLLPGIPVHLNAVIHVVGEAELFQAQSDGVPRHLLHGISRVVAEGGVYMIVSQHAPSPLPGH